MIMTSARPLTATDERIYAIGDVHGRIDLLGDLISRIRKDSAERGCANTTIVLLGNLIDHGPSSADLIRKFMHFTAHSSRVVVLKGRQEAMLADSLAGSLMLLGLWVQLGGDATLASWGVDPAIIAGRDLPELLRAARQTIPQAVMDWLNNLPLSYRSGDFFFGSGSDVLEAGEPDRASIQPCRHDVRISNAFINREHEHRATIAPLRPAASRGTSARANQSGSGMGAVHAPQLTALGLEGTERWTLRTGPERQAPQINRAVLQAVQAHAI